MDTGRRPFYYRQPEGVALRGEKRRALDKSKPDTPTSISMSGPWLSPPALAADCSTSASTRRLFARLTQSFCTRSSSRRSNSSWTVTASATRSPSSAPSASPPASSSLSDSRYSFAVCGKIVHSCQWKKRWGLSMSGGSTRHSISCDEKTAMHSIWANCFLIQTVIYRHSMRKAG